MSGCTVSTSLPPFSPFLISLSLSLSLPLYRMPGGWGARRGKVGEDIRRAGDAAAVSSTMREKGERHRLTARATSGSSRQRGSGGGGEDAKARDSGWRRRRTTRRVCRGAERIRARPSSPDNGGEAKEGRRGEEGSTKKMRSVTLQEAMAGLPEHGDSRMRYSDVWRRANEGGEGEPAAAVAKETAETRLRSGRRRAGAGRRRQGSWARHQAMQWKASAVSRLVPAAHRRRWKASVVSRRSLDAAIAVA
uniref:Uncharacterized protein n=1 Tax=Oryza rufipogon TaxID=4529 RepID=A0A0E0P2B6_ORYRU